MSRKAAASTAFFLIAVLGIFPTAANAGSADSSGSERAGQLAVKVTSTDSKPKIKVARNLKVLVSCS